MIKHTTTRFGIAVVLAGSLSGCASNWPFSTASQEPEFPDTTEARLVEAQKSLDQYKAQHGAGSPSPENSGGISGALGSATQAVQDAFTIEPRKGKSPDPLALSNKPKKIGADVFLTAGAFFEGQGQMEKAREQYQRVLQDDADHLLALVSMARLSDRMGNSGEAESFYKRAIAAHPQSALAYNDLGLFYARKHQPQQGVAALAKATALEDSNLRYSNNYAALLVEVGQYDRAFEQLRNSSTPAEAHYNLGFLLHRNNQDQLAQQHFGEALRLNPQMEQAQAMLARLNSQGHQAQRQAQAYQAAESYQAVPSGYQADAPRPGPASQYTPAPQRSVSPSPAQEYVPYGGAPGQQAYTAGNQPLQHLPPVNQR